MLGTVCSDEFGKVELCSWHRFKVYSQLIRFRITAGLMNSHVCSARTIVRTIDCGHPKVGTVREGGTGVPVPHLRSRSCSYHTCLIKSDLLVDLHVAGTGLRSLMHAGHEVGRLKWRGICDRPRLDRPRVSCDRPE
jgi:hypothetical protein